jgi:hypothetical protein
MGIIVLKLRKITKKLIEEIQGLKLNSMYKNLLFLLIMINMGHQDIFSRDFGKLKSFRHQQSHNKNKFIKTCERKLVKERKVSIQHNNVQSYQVVVQNDKDRSVCETD